MSKYDIILDVFRTGSISKTAQSKNYSQPAVSQIISSFEKEIGFSVFKRETISNKARSIAIRLNIKDYTRGK